MGKRVKQVGRAATLMTKLAGLITVSALASGCSLLPFGRTSREPAAMMPELHEVKSKAEPDCLAETDVAIGKPAVTTTPVVQVDLNAPADPGEAELQRLMDGNKRFVEGEAENAYQWPQRPGEERTGRAPVAMVVACSDWQILPESAFDARAGELFVVRIAGNAAVDEAVIESAKFAIQQYDIPLILVLGHEGCTAIKASLTIEHDAVEGRAASATIPHDSGEADDHANDAARGNADATAGDAPDPLHLDGAVHANVDEMVNRLRQADPARRGRVTAGQLTVVGAYYDETNGQITLEAAPSAEEQFVATPRD
jgi:carbonic anhydrase